MQIATYAGTKAILEKYGHHPKKSLGQNFLIDPHVLGKIIRAADIGPEDTVLEIGPGIGGLTQALAQSAGHVIAVELDKRLIPVLKDHSLPNVEIIHSDILDYTIPSHIQKVVANLPYYVTTPIVMHLLENYHFQSITVMVQKEVAQRMVSTQGGKGDKGEKSYGALSLAIQYYADAEIAANVPSNSFMPRPQVGSAVVHMNIKKEPPVTADKKALFANIKAGFGQRRKTLVNSLFASELYPFDKNELATIITELGFSESIRGEALTLEAWAKLTEALIAHATKRSQNATV
ncbi:MAG: 16S rRNA (adenine(1518)-N(6)/adenine(1519)-N(6))-dimethyltransferase RsmA [Defluviitaleaceae bacterium]|nr:16S rRNA (adenine(1518)-N(6)/adenine(1519)-N(6))-dimethyltransferase RsmA [Defluviitaleaceae bacterium]